MGRQREKSWVVGGVRGLSVRFIDPDPLQSFGAGGGQAFGGVLHAGLVLGVSAAFAEQMHHFVPERDELFGVGLFRVDEDDRHPPSYCEVARRE